MKTRPILFSAPMVRAILDGRKTQTRRIVKPQFSADVTEINERPALDPILKCVVSGHSGEWQDGHSLDEVRRCPYGQPGDRLSVKEHAWMFCEKVPNGTTKTGRAKWRYVPLRAAPILYCADHSEKPTVGVVHPDTANSWGWRKKLGRFLPGWASRITLEITKVRVEKLNDISEADAIAEGFEPEDAYDDGDHFGVVSAKESYRTLWESLNGPGSWEANPWVWVVTFKKIEP
jgi:hypothetical protein